jgi:transcriptional regulator with XRE-family HTH domain
MADAPDSAAHDFAGLALVLRRRAAMTQRGVAARVGVSERTVRLWEDGLGHPGAANLRRLIGLYLAQGAFQAGREREEAAALWVAALRETPSLRAPFDAEAFAALVADAQGEARPSARAGDPAYDWGEAPSAAAFHGRQAEVDTLTHWIVQEGFRLVGVVGMGGLGKTALAAKLARDLAPHFEAVHWRSLRNATPSAEWLAGAVAFLSEQRVVPAGDEEARLRQLLGQLRARRCLVVLDNLETVLQPAAAAPTFLEGYAAYGHVIAAVAEGGHRSCLVVTSREQPPELSPGEGVGLLRLGGLDDAAAQALLADRGLVGDAAAWRSLVARYGGNALALQMVAETIAGLFGGEIASFLGEAEAVFGDIHRLLAAQFARLSPTEQAVLSRLAVAREPVRFRELAADLGQGVGHGGLIDAVEALGRRSLLERGDDPATFTLQPVVLDFATATLVEAVSAELDDRRPSLVATEVLVQAQAKD